MTLRERTEEFIARGNEPGELYGLLRGCVADGSLEALSCVRRLFEDDYGGITYNALLKAPAASTLIIWGEQGVRALYEGAKEHPTSKNISFCSELLASVAAGSVLPVLCTVGDPEIAAKIEEARATHPQLAEYARARLVELVLSFESDDEAAHYIGSAISSLTFLPSEASAARELFAALSARWLAVSTPVMQRYEALINEHASEEPKFQSFLTEHPQLLDPMVVQVWPQPNFFGSRFPDFVIQRADGSYAIVEIETPAKALVTSNGNLTSYVTHAERQVVDYKTYLMRHIDDAQRHFPKFDDPDCLVVTGLERNLQPDQAKVLHDANCTRVRLRIAGFDWLANRARTIAANITRQHVKVHKIRID